MENQRLQRKIEELEDQWNLLSEKLSRLEQARIPETQADEIFRLEKEIAKIKADREQIEKELNDIEAKLNEDVSPIVEAVDPTSLRNAYLTRLLKAANQLDLTGIDRKAAGHDVETRLHLGAIYTALLTLSTDHVERGSATERDVTERGVIERDFQERRLSALDQLNRHDRLVLLGGPGSGKSTFVKFVAMCLAGELLGDPDTNLTLLTAPLPEDQRSKRQRKKDATPQQWQHGQLLPVPIILRDFAAKGLPPEGQPATAKYLWEFIVRTLQEALLEAYVPYLQQHVLTHGALVLLDGLDEVPEADRRRGQITQIVEDFAITFPKCRMLVTSRTYAYQQQDWRLSDFAETVLAPFTKAQIRFFVDHWYAHFAEVRGMDRDNAQGRAELLKRAIFGSDRLHDFAKRPLLLTLMASLHAWRGGSLPEKRGELYAEATDLLLDWWETAKVVRDDKGKMTIEQPSLTEMLQMGKECIQQALNALAFEAHKGQPELVGTADIPQGELVTKLINFSENKDVKPVRLIEFLSERAGLLVPRGVGVYTYPHRTFQEYLAACYLTEQDEYPENVAELVRQDPNRWREVVLLAAARFSDAALMLWALVEALCYQEVETASITPQDVWSALLAGQALTETANLTRISPRNQSKARRVRDWMVAILTEQQPSETPFPVVERALAGNILAHLDDPRPGVGLREDGLPDIVWCDVPAGEFLMGSDPKKDKEASDWEQPQHEVRLSAYCIDRYPVTNAQYRAFVENGGYTERWQKCWTPEGWEWKEKKNVEGPNVWGGLFDLENHPVIGVSWYEAVAFCNWLTLCLREQGKLSDGQGIRLPTEAEWEKAARGHDGRIYPWGNEKITPELVNYGDTGLGATSAVGCFPRGVSPYGCEDMVGNVYEWCLDWFDGEYYAESPEENPQGPDSGSDRVVRGGAWFNDAGDCRSAYRDCDVPDYRDDYIGFRLLRTP